MMYKHIDKRAEILPLFVKNVSSAIDEFFPLSIFMKIKIKLVLSSEASWMIDR